MTRKTGIIWLCVGLTVGLAGGWLLFGQTKTVWAGNDRHDDFIITTAPLTSGLAGVPDVDSLWILDYRAGRLLASIVGASGRIGSWAEVDLIREFGIPRHNAAHFLMTNGVVRGRSVMYVAETTSGKMGVYTVAMQNNEVLVRRHDMVAFRAPIEKAAVEIKNNEPMEK